MVSMGKYLITGSAGAGKSSVIRELQSRGFAAYDTDSHPGATLFQHKDGSAAEFPEGAIDWDTYEWNWQDKVITPLLSSDTTVFLGGVATNTHKYYSQFDTIFVLTLDEDTLKKRILGRTEKDYGKHPDELKGLLEYLPIVQKELLAEPNTYKIDSTKSLGKIVSKVLSRIARSTS